ncbi:MAG: hypothetical protein EOO56_15950 [Hymenobacter sp.]|nr:MAG: hypothetical protein EOO56_15950 [Hymenobacter sp.]
MTEPNNPLFEDEKEFLERKKLEYERALRGDVEEIKVQTVQAGKVALVGAGVVGGIWLLVKAFSGSKPKKKHHRKHKKHAASFEDYAGFDGFDDDSHDEELDALAATYSPEYAYDHADRFLDDDGFYQGGDSIDQHYYQDDEQTADADDADDNGLNDYPDFPAHSSSQHGFDADTAAIDTTYGSHASDQALPDVYHTDENHGDEEPAHSFASANSYQARPYDDSRRLPESNSFADSDEEAAAAPTKKKAWLVPAIMGFAQSETGKVVLAQVAAVAMAFVSSKVRDILPSSEAKTGKNADLAGSSAPVGVSPATWPATTAAQDVSAAAHHDDTITPREPLA